MVELKPGSRVHFVGIGGVGMSALAELLHGRGFRVTGSDRQASALTDRLGGLGIGVQIGHSAGAVEGVDAVVYTPAVSADNPELSRARERSIPVWKRAEILGALSRGHRLVAVAGTHGKTTTTAMVGAVLEAAGLDPTVVGGGVVRGPEGILRPGGGKTWVVEADEFDRSFLTLSPTVAVVTSMDADHLDVYGNLDAIRAAFTAFLERVETGCAVLCADAPAVAALPVGNGVERMLYGTSEGARIRADGVEQAGFGSRFRVRDGDRLLGTIRLQAPGLHNVSNALAAVGVGTALGLSWKAMQAGLDGFQGVHRRFEVLGESGGATVVSDYAHHPAEIRATLAAARQGWTGRIVAVFQPHLYSRTRDLATEFGAALCGADRVWITDVYPAREAPIPGVDGALIASCVRAAGGPEPEYVPRLEDLLPALSADLQAGDLVVVMGAGDVEKVAHGLMGGGPSPPNPLSRNGRGGVESK